MKLKLKNGSTILVHATKTNKLNSVDTDQSLFENMVLVKHNLRGSVLLPWPVLLEEWFDLFELNHRN